jgi:spermidine/putrescine transport system substrate-binding protein
LREVTFYGWADDLPPSVIEDFARESGVQVRYESFESQEEAVDRLRAGASYDVVVFESDWIPALADQGLLAALDFRNLPNFRHVGPEFQDLAVDPGNRHSVPFRYGTTGLLVRRDLVQRPVTRWADLWEADVTGKVAFREMREVMGLTALSLGYPLDSEDPAHLQAVVDRLIALKPKMLPVEVDEEKAVARLLSGECAVLVGWSGDYWQARQQTDTVDYVVPAEGTGLSGDGFVVPATSTRKQDAERRIDFLLRPEVNAAIVNAKAYPTTNRAALELVDPDLRADPVVVPPPEDLKRAAFYRPLSANGERLYQDAWARFLSAGTFASP